jgi:integrase
VAVASIHQHRKRWRVKWRDEQGRQIVESYATKKDAEKAARTIEARTVLDGRPPVTVSPDALTLAKWWDRWEPGRQWRPSTRATHTVHWNRYIKPVFGRVRLEQITTADVRRWHRKLEARNLAPRTVATIHRTLSMALQGAVEDELLARNPARTAKLKRPVQIPPVALDTATVAALLAGVDQTTPALSTYARLLASTGLRRSEGTGLTWDRVDLDAGCLVVDRQLDYSAPNQPAWSPTKTSENRIVLLTPACVLLLREHRAAQPVVALKDALVFTRPNGSAWPRATLADAWRRAATKLAKDGTPLPDGARGWHTLRHTVGSRLLEAGIPPAEAAALLGHSVETLLATYTHVVDRAAADDRLRAALS